MYVHITSSSKCVNVFELHVLEPF